jgi:chromosome segregation ATPase
MSEEEKTFSQEELDNIIKDRLGREKSKQEEVEGQLNKLEQELAEVKKKNEQLKGAAEEVPVLKRQALVTEIATEYKLPKRIATRLSGDTREELEDDAKALLAELEAMQVAGVPGIPAGEPAEPKLDARGTVLQEMKRINEGNKKRRRL